MNLNSRNADQYWYPLQNIVSVDLIEATIILDYVWW